MGRPPFNNTICIKKGPWTPEEDITLVSYIQEHGPGNWRCVPTNTGLMRCSKSCRLRWTNYLRPGIKRGNFTPQEEQKIIHLQTLLGNKWAAIASHLPQRTDNDVKNFWNIHLKKKLLRTNMESAGNNCRIELTDSIGPVNNIHFPLLGQDLTPTPTPTIAASNCPSSMYVLSTENISQLLKSWKRTPHDTKSSSSSSCTTDYNDINKNTHDDIKERDNDYSHLESILPFNHNLEEDFGTRWNTAELEMEIDGVFC